MNIQPKIQAMIDNPGVYLVGDTNAPEVGAAIYSMGGKLYKTKLDGELSAEGFFGSATVTGPLKLPPAPNPAQKILEAALFACGAPRDHLTGKMGDLPRFPDGKSVHDLPLGRISEN
jgi:hypothetical protein